MGIFHRTSIRKYTSAAVEEEKIELILRAGMQAPSAKNGQPWEIYVVTSPKVIAELAGATMFTKPCTTANVVFVPCYRKESAMPQFNHIDMSACVENMLLEADELGLGACWMGVAPKPDAMKNVTEIVQIPEHLTPFALISCGYPAEEKVQQSRFDESRVHRVK